MTLQPPSIDQDALTLGNIPHGSSKMVQQVISNRTQQPILWRIDTCGTNWLSVDRKTGSLQTGEQQTIYVTAYTNSLTHGDYASTLSFTTEVAGIKSALQVQAELHVNAIPYGDNGPKAPTVAPNYFNFDATQHNNFDMTQHN